MTVQAAPGAAAATHCYMNVCMDEREDLAKCFGPGAEIKRHISAVLFFFFSIIQCLYQKLVHRKIS